MLVLSRRPSEKILFPNLGISVEIIQTKGNTVRVGIEAPPEIRVLRDELAEQEDFEPIYSLSQSSDFSSIKSQQKDQLCQQIDEIGLAIALAQNQQRQGLTDNVDMALEQATERLQVLKNLLQTQESTDDSTLDQALVCEPRLGYQRNRSDHLETNLELAESSSPRSRVPFRLNFEMALAD